MEQGLRELKEEKKAISTKVVTPPSILLLAPLLPLTNLLTFNPLFFLFPNLLSYDTP